MADRVLVDSSVWVEAMRPAGDAALRQRTQDLVRTGRAVLCHWVLLELWNGARGEGEKRWLRQLEADLETVPTSTATWESACELARACRRAGITVPASDLLIAACVRQHGLQLLHRDAHFDQIAGVGPG